MILTYLLRTETTLMSLLWLPRSLLVAMTLRRPIILSERETAVTVSRQEQRHLGRGFLPYRPVRSTLWSSQITSRPISALHTVPQHALITTVPDCTLFPYMMLEAVKQRNLK